MFAVSAIYISALITCFAYGVISRMTLLVILVLWLITLVDTTTPVLVNHWFSYGGCFLFISICVEESASGGKDILYYWISHEPYYIVGYK